MVRRGLASSRTEAGHAVLAGLVTVGGAPATRAGALVAADAAVVVQRGARRFVSRGGEKLAAALDRFDIDVAGKDCLDAGASTGGFTDCLLQAGAGRVIAVDVGYGQLAWSLRGDDRVTVMERTNVRSLTPSGLPYPPAMVVADLSFISLRTVMTPLVRLSAEPAELVVLVKPQFEAGSASVDRGGVVRDPSAWRRAMAGVAAAAAIAGAGVAGAMASSLLGPAGNVEFLLHLRAGRESSQAAELLDAAVREGTTVAAGAAAVAAGSALAGTGPLDEEPTVSAER